MRLGYPFPVLVLLGQLNASCDEKAPTGRAPKSSALAIGSTPANEPQSASTPSAAPPEVRRSRWLLKPPGPEDLPEEVLPLELTSKARVQDGDGCKTASIFYAHGWLAGRPVRATLTFRAKHLKIELVDIETSKQTVYAGNVDPSGCVKKPGPLELNGLLTAAGNAQPARLRARVAEETQEPAQGHLSIQGSDVARRRDTLELYEVPSERFGAIEEFERRLGSPADIHAALQIADDRTLVAHFDLEVQYDDELPARRVLVLSELDTKQRGATRTMRTSLSCSFLDCRAALLGYRLSPDSVLLLPTVSQMYCGAGCGDVTHGALWMLRSDGFLFVGDLIEADRTPELHNYPSVENDTLVHWVNADDRPPLDLLVRTESPNEQAAADLELWVFNPENNVYESVGPVPRPSADQTAQLPILLRMTPAGR